MRRAHTLTHRSHTCLNSKSDILIEIIKCLKSGPNLLMCFSFVIDDGVVVSRQDIIEKKKKKK